VALVAFASLTSTAWADDYTGTVSMLEVWASGNVAFQLATSTPTCNGQFILNASSPGFKNLYAAVLAAQSRGAAVKVTTSGCGPADGYGGNYNLPLYIYPQT